MLKKIIKYSLLSILLAFFIFTLGGRIFGIRYYVVISDSMYPTIPKNSLVYIKTIDIDEPLDYNEIVAIETGEIPLMHRVIDFEGNKVITHGDNNDTGVNEKIDRNQIFGKYIFSIPLIGILFRSVYPLLILSLIIIAFLIGEQLLKELKKK